MYTPQILKLIFLPIVLMSQHSIEYHFYVYYYNIITNIFTVYLDKIKVSLADIYPQSTDGNACSVSHVKFTML